ncbi:hypothetical protein PGT21_000095 [Puccinia graminis f. sp. tritici]|uniref:Golgi to ER traffic-protein n=1 Tax=Puccinia graminis f. sp. tritici TaxID=56615 RepID=A0A5B0M940_PUCGR|nr:hypothetical protein PGT21_000095 [Puccinia graminis f. sp. tritici]
MGESIRRQEGNALGCSIRPTASSDGASLDDTMDSQTRGHTTIQAKDELVQGKEAGPILAEIQNKQPSSLEDKLNEETAAPKDISGSSPFSLSSPIHVDGGLNQENTLATQGCSQPQICLVDDLSAATPAGSDKLSPLEVTFSPTRGSQNQKSTSTTETQDSSPAYQSSVQDNFLDTNDSLLEDPALQEIQEFNTTANLETSQIVDISDSPLNGEENTPAELETDESRHTPNVAYDIPNGENPIPLFNPSSPSPLAKYDVSDSQRCRTVGSPKHQALSHCMQATSVLPSSTPAFCRQDSNEGGMNDSRSLETVQMPSKCGTIVPTKAPSPQQQNKTPTPNRLAAQQLHTSRKEVRKLQYAKKLGIHLTELDPYDLYSDPIWLGDILVELTGGELQSRLESQKEVLLELIGNTRMEFGWYAKEMLDTITLNFLKTVSAEKETQEKTRFLFVDGGKWAFLQDAIADTKQFGAILRRYTHPYFNNNTLKIDVLSKPIDVKLGGDIRSGSWFSLNFLTCGTSTSSWPDPKSDFARKMESSISQLIQTARDSVCALHKKVRPSGPDKSQVEKEKEMNGRSAAKDYLVLKLTAMGACMKNTAETSHHEGLSHLLQKIFEMFLGVVMIYEGYACINLEKNGAAKSDKLYKRGGAMLRDTLNHNNWTTEGQYEAEVQGHEEKSKDWTELKQRSIGALVLFLNFGIQGVVWLFQKPEKIYLSGYLFIDDAGARYVSQGYQHNLESNQTRYTYSMAPHEQIPC